MADGEALAPVVRELSSGFAFFIFGKREFGQKPDENGRAAEERGGNRGAVGILRVYPIGDKTMEGTRVGDRKTCVATTCPQGR